MLATTDARAMLAALWQMPFANWLRDVRPLLADSLEEARDPRTEWLRQVKEVPMVRLSLLEGDYLGWIHSRHQPQGHSLDFLLVGDLQGPLLFGWTVLAENTNWRSGVYPRIRVPRSGLWVRVNPAPEVAIRIHHAANAPCSITRTNHINPATIEYANRRHVKDHLADLAGRA